jgi:hypothetical protein
MKVGIGAGAGGVTLGTAAVSVTLSFAIAGVLWIGALGVLAYHGLKEHKDDVR